MHKHRLLKLAAHLRTVRPRNFDMAFFGGREKGCQTDGCAAGHAADIVPFRRQGYDCKTLPTFKNYTGAEAVKAFFGVHSYGYYKLFSSCNAPSTAKQVAKRIEEFVEADGAARPKCYER